MKNFIKNIFYPFFILINKVNLKKYNYDIYDTETTLKSLKNNKSISRFGDGEFELIKGKNLQYQDANIALIHKLKMILMANDVDDNHFIAIPYALKDMNDLNYESKKYWIFYKYFRCKQIFKILNDKYKYYDSQITRIYINRKNKEKSRFYFKLWKDIWDKKEVLIVEGEFTRFGVNNDLFSNVKSINRIICPSKNAFNYYSDIYNTIVNFAKDKLVLIILGPTATLLSYELSKIGIRAIDIGNLDMEYEWSKAQTRNKIEINGKYSSEIKSTDNIEEIKDRKYYQEIIARIGC
ncbi:MAG: glycosyl transferase family 8 [Phascolarctobacterium sp.]|nr:MAG: glycosyl transferase family 8 [Phascolarctobacterium sp.]